MAIFYGWAFGDAAELRPYLVIANESRNDLTLVDARVNASDAAVVNAPILLRPLALPFPDRPALLAAASLQDGLPDALVAVSAGDSVLQLVGTWLANYAVAGTVDLAADVLAVVALPSPAGTARFAVALEGLAGDPAARNRLAIVQYRRGANGTVEVDPSYDGDGVAVHELGFRVSGLATMPGDELHVYAATLDPIGPGAVLGVAQVDVSAPAAPWTVVPLGARAGTRLVAAGRVRERLADTLALDPAAFADQPLVERVYAVLDEGSCGAGKAIDCGVVVLDPSPVTATIPDDWAGWMPYRAPIRLPTRPLALAVAQPPVNAPSEADSIYQDDYMRFATNEVWATTGVGVVAGEDHLVYFLDLGRFKLATANAPPVVIGATVVSPTDDNRLWIQPFGTINPDDFAGTATAAAGELRLTPGYTPDQSWTVAYQETLPGLSIRAAEAGRVQPGGEPWLAIQIGDGTPGDPGCPGAPCAGRLLSQVARLYHPALGVAVGDIVVIRVKVAGADICEGAAPPGTPTGTDVAHEFEAEVKAILAPSDAYPGGAVVLGERSPLKPLEVVSAATLAAWSSCLAELTSRATSGLKGLVVTIRSGELALVGDRLGYAGRPGFGLPYTLQYRADAGQPDEDALAAACPLADWDGSWPAPAGVLDCNGAGCDRATCEQLVLARKARRYHHLAEDCRGDAKCLDRFPAATFPRVNGPALAFQVGHQIGAGDTNVRSRALSLSLSFSTTSGAAAYSWDPGSASVRANGALAFDRSTEDPASGYRLLVSYPGDMVVDVSPSVAPVSAGIVR
jgi:hypothetical protein